MLWVDVKDLKFTGLFEDAGDYPALDFQEVRNKLLSFRDGI